MSAQQSQSAYSPHSASRLPGGFETDTELEPDHDQLEDGNYAPDHFHDSHDSSSLLGSLASMHESSVSVDKQTLGQTNSRNEGEGASMVQEPNNTVLEEQEMHKKLSDFESTFIPELSHLSIQSMGDQSLELRTSEDSFGFGRENENLATRKRHDVDAKDFEYHVEQDEDERGFSSPKTPPGMYQTPAPEQQEYRESRMNQDHGHTLGPNTSGLEAFSSSPAAARTVSRVQSMATIGGYETADEREFPESPTRKAPRTVEDPDATPRKNNELGASSSTADSSFDGPATGENGLLTVGRKRPKYLNSRSANARLSYDSVASSATDTSEATLGADFALQSGGAAPESRLQRKPRMTLSRSTSLGSIVSGVSNISDDEGPSRRAAAEPPELSTLAEESPAVARNGKLSPNPSLSTPRPSIANLAMPSDTVVANHVRDLEVPGSFARQYKQDRSVSPEKPISMAAMTPGAKKGLTLKEHRSTVEKLGKENFDLKMKIHFLDQALQRRSEDGIKEMITENVQLKSDRMRLEKDNHSLRKQVRDLQKKLDAANGERGSPNGDPGYGTDEERSPTIEEEVTYLRERVETTEVEIERLRRENVAKETEKRRLAEMVRSLGDTRAAVSDVGSREERDMWKDMLEAETIAREQSEEENKKLRDEVAKMRQETFGSGGKAKKLRKGGSSIVSRSSSVEGSTVARADNAEIERLRHEISELQKMIGAQASTLTSRNKEKERLYQEIEDLKLGRMGGVRSVAGDSILDRSASRARSNSRASIGTRFSRLSEPEREQFDARIGELRDEVSHLKLDNQNLQGQFDEALAELEALDTQAQADADQFNEELILLTQERDNALREAEDQDQAFQQLKQEAQEEIDGLGDELDAKVDECARLEEELKSQAENVQALQSEMRSASEGLVRLEQDAQQNLSRYKSVKVELDDARRELEGMEKNFNESEGKIQRFTVQQESAHNEIAFLREEQDADKIKIGDLESLLQKLRVNHDSERDRAKDLDRRLAEERHQRESVSSQEKQEIQRMINDLNREATGAKDELRRVRKALSSREIEVNTYKERLTELEDGLRHVLRDTNGSRASLINAVTKLQRDFEEASTDLDSTKQRLDDHQTLLANRDALLESSGLECRKIADLLERERQARRQDKHSFEQSLKSHQQATRALTTNNARIAELEQARQAHRKQLSQLEGQFKDQLAERNQVLLTLWKRLCVICGPDWAHNHSLINGNLPSQEVVGNVLFWPGFSRNLLLAAKQVESTFSSLKDKIKRVEREVWKEYHNLEQMFEVRNKKLERIEESWEKMKLRQQEIEAGIHSSRHTGSRASAGQMGEVQKLRAENRLLRAELQLLQQQSANSAHIRSHARGGSRASGLSGVIFPHDDDGMSLDGAGSGTSGGIPVRHSSMHRNTTMGQPYNVQQNGGISRSTSVTLGGGSGGTTYENIGDGWPNSPERAAGSLMIPTKPYEVSSGATLARPPVVMKDGAVQVGDDGSGRDSVNGYNSSDAGTITTQTLMNMTMGQGQERWIHRLRELERRLKAEREQRLIDRTGMRKRLEEREAVNEELRRELERERVRKSWTGTMDSNHDNQRGSPAEHDEGRASATRQTTEDEAVYLGRPSGSSGGSKMGIPSLNNRVVEVEGSPVRGRR